MKVISLLVDCINGALVFDFRFKPALEKIVESKALIHLHLHE